MELTDPGRCWRAAARRVRRRGGVRRRATSRLSFAELHERVPHDRPRCYLAAGVGPATGSASGRRTAWHWVVAALGALYAGAALVPVNTRYTGHEALDIVEPHARAARSSWPGPFLGVDRLAAAARSGRSR